jgi:hypothetical protein
MQIIIITLSSETANGLEPEKKMRQNIRLNKYYDWLKATHYSVFLSSLSIQIKM